MKEEGNVMEKKVYKVVLTGGPCAGKTTMMNRIVSEFSERGFKVIVCPEGATELIPNGVIPGQNGISMEDYQYIIAQKQLDKEALYHDIAIKMTDEKVLIMFDRGLMDGQCYVTPEIFTECLSYFGLDRSAVMGRYDAVIHLTTAAKGGEEMYTTENNAARSEGVKQACELDDRVLAAWVGHPHLRVVDNAEDFEDKIQAAMREMYSILGEPVPMEIENKYLVKVPDIELLKKYGAVKSRIMQTYLMQVDDGIERRVRLQEIGDCAEPICSYTEKSEVDANKRVEFEHKISLREYAHLVKEANADFHPVIKERYCFIYKSQYFELDIYPGKNVAIMELELTDENQNVELPDFIDVIKEVTRDKRYRNHSIAKYGVPEE